LYSNRGEGTQILDIGRDFEAIPDLPEVIDGVVYCPGTINLKPIHRLTIADFQEE
jgi:hypothetical protein